MTPPSSRSSQKQRQIVRSFTRGDVKMAVSALRQSPARSFLTMFGIVIAVAAVILVIAIGEGVKQQVQGQVDKLGKNLLLIRPGATSHGLVGGLGSLAGPTTVSGLDERDLKAVSATKGVVSAVPLSTVDGTVRTDENRTDLLGPVVATNDAFVEVLHQNVKYGSFLGSNMESDSRAVIGSDVAASLFRENVPLGRSFTFRGHEFVVSGILNQFDSNPLLGDADFNNAIFIKYNVAQRLTDGNAAIYQILAQLDEDADIEQVSASMSRQLEKVHGGARNFSVLRQGQSLAATNSILDTLTRFTITAAVITLLIGGVGIMNVMLVSVAERMHEIGIRKAVGATSRQILSQFLTESLVLSGVGAVGGLVLASALVYLISLYTDLQLVMPWPAAITMVLIAILVGTMFGSVPAIKAARKDPIDALRSQ